MNKPVKIDKDEVKENVRDAKLNIYQRLNLVQQIVTYVQKNKPSGMKYSIVSHDDVTHKVRKPLVEAGVIYYPIYIEYTQSGNRTEVKLDLVFQNVDDKEDQMIVACLGYGVDPSDKGPGKAVSYAVKYGLLKALGLETGDDADYDDIPHETTIQDEPETATEEWQGPLGKHDLKTRLRAFNTDITSVEDSGSMQELMNQTKELRNQCEADLPEWFEPMEKAIEAAAARVEGK